MSVTHEQDQRDPPVHVITEDGKLRICLSYVAKWVAGIIAGILTLILTGAFTFAWQSNQALGVILAKLETMNERLDRYYHRLERVEDKLDGKADKCDLRA